MKENDPTWVCTPPERILLQTGSLNKIGRYLLIMSLIWVNSELYDVEKIGILSENWDNLCFVLLFGFSTRSECLGMALTVQSALLIRESG